MPRMLPILLITLAISLAAFPQSHPRRGGGPDRAQDLLEQARRALGGKAGLSSIQSLSASGTFRRVVGDHDLTGDFEITLQIPDKYTKTETISPISGVTITSIDKVDGERVLLDSRTSGQAHLVFNRPGTGNASPEAKAAAEKAVRLEFARLLVGWLLTAPGSLGAEFTYAGQADVLGGHADSIEVKSAVGLTARLLLDQKTHLPLMLTYFDVAPRAAMYVSQGGTENQAQIAKKITDQLARESTEQVEVQVRLSDYRTVDDKLFPYHMAKVVNGKVTEEWNLSRFSINPKPAADRLGEHDDLLAGNELFKAGKFPEAEKLFSNALAQSPDSYEAALQLGAIALLSNRLDEAEKRLTAAMRLKPAESAAKAFLAEVYYRRDNFQKAAPLFRAAGKEAKAKKLESFKDTVPYQIDGAAQETHLSFVHTDPLPLLRVKVNGGEEVNFIIDTGAAEVIIDTDFAKKIGATQSGSQQWTFGGDQKGEMGEGCVDTLTMGDFVIRSVPVNILSTRRFAAAARGLRVDGIIGTVLLYHFISTLDYVNGELVLRRRTQENSARLEQQAAAAGQIAVPFWMASDHLMLAWGSVNNYSALLFYVDTGAAGIGFTAPQSTLDAAAIKVAQGRETEGIGGGGTVKITPFAVDELSLGDARERDIIGVFGAFPASMETRFGFRVGGLISHQFFRSYAVTFDFDAMRLLMKRKS